MLGSTKECTVAASHCAPRAFRSLAVQVYGGFWVPLWSSFLIFFWYVMWFGLSKSALGLQTCFLTTVGWNICSFLMSQPFKNIVNIMVFMIFHIFIFFMTLMASGTYLDVIFEVSGGLEAPLWWFLRVLLGHWVFIEFYGQAGWHQNPEDLVSGG